MSTIYMKADEVTPVMTLSIIQAARNASALSQLNQGLSINALTIGVESI